MLNFPADGDPEIEADEYVVNPDVIFSDVTVTFVGELLLDVTSYVPGFVILVNAKPTPIPLFTSFTPSTAIIVIPEFVILVPAPFQKYLVLSIVMIIVLSGVLFGVLVDVRFSISTGLLQEESVIKKPEVTKMRRIGMVDFIMSLE